MLQKASSSAYFLINHPVFPWNLPNDPMELMEEEWTCAEWGCADQTRIKVGDEVYLLGMRKIPMGVFDEPVGIIASGRAIVPPKEKQLRYKEPEYSHLSAAYTDCIDHGHIGDEYLGKEYTICIRFDSLVDFDVPLRKEAFHQLPQFQSYDPNLIPPFRQVYLKSLGSWCRFVPNNSAKVQALASAWEVHVLAQKANGKGVKLIDFYLEKGEQLLAEQDYWTAKDFFEKILEIQSYNEHAIHKLEICKSKIKEECAHTIMLNSPSLEKETLSVISPDLARNLLLQAELDDIRNELDKQEPLILLDTKEARKRVLSEIARRRGQTKFRQTLLQAYRYKCAITGFDAEDALEAAHIIPYAKTGNNDPTNGILLRADLHTLFDLNLLAIHPDILQVSLHPTLQHTQYHPLHGKQIRVPEVEALRPNKKHLAERLQQCTWMNAHQP